VLVTRFDDKREIQHLAGLFVLAAPCQGDALTDKVFFVHESIAALRGFR